MSRSAQNVRLGNRRSIQLSYGASAESGRKTSKNDGSAHTLPTPGAVSGLRTDSAPAAKLNEGAGPCVEWAGPRDRQGYGIQSKYGETRAHRVAWVAANGPIPNGLWVLHSCDNRACTAIGHLRLGTNADNVADRQARQRQARGSRYGNSKLTEEKVALIKRLLREGAMQVHLAQHFRVTKACISNIVTGRTWSWLEAA